MSDSTAAVVVAARPRKVITAKGRGKAALNKVPDDILNNPELRLAMEVLPDNYNLEIPKVTWNLYMRIILTCNIDRPFGGYEEMNSREWLCRCPRD